MNRALRHLLVLAACGALAACGRGMIVSVGFSDSVSLHRGMPVFLDDSEVGDVSGLTPADGGTVAELSLDPERVAGLNSGSAALLTTRNGDPVIELYNYRPGTEPLREGDRLVALNNLAEYTFWQAGEALDAGRQSMEEMTRSMNEYFESEDWRRKKEDMNRRLEAMKEELGRSYEQTREAYRRFMEDLENDAAAAEERARQSYAELERQLREQIERLRQQGDEHIVKPLQQLLEDLSRALEKKPEQRTT